MPRVLLISILGAASLSSVSVAQSTVPAASTASSPRETSAATAGTSPVAGNPAPGTPRIAPGSVIPVELTRTVDAKKAKPGDEVIAKVTQDMKAASGEVIVAKDTKMVGHVTEAQARTKEQKESEVGIAFDKAVTKNGDMMLPMSIQAVIVPRQNNQSNDGESGGETGPVTGGGTATSPMGNRAPLSVPSQPQSPPSAAGDAQSGARPPITANTHGVIGMPDMKLQANVQNASQGSVVSSEKSNVKLESGTMLLLRVNQ